MHKIHNPNTAAGPFADYSLGLEVAPNARWLSLAGQVGARPDGSVPDDIEEQVEWTFRNIFAILEAAGMGVEHMVRMTSYLTHADYWPAYRKVKARMMGPHRPTSTLLVISGLAVPAWKVEIESWAAKP